MTQENRLNNLDPDQRRIYDFYQQNDFTVNESLWAAENNLAPDSAERWTRQAVRDIVNSRRLWIRDYRRFFPNRTREQAILDAERTIASRNRRAGLTGRDVFNIFKSISPT